MFPMARGADVGIVEMRQAEEHGQPHQRRRPADQPGQHDQRHPRNITSSASAAGARSAAVLPTARHSRRPPLSRTQAAPPARRRAPSPRRREGPRAEAQAEGPQPVMRTRQRSAAASSRRSLTPMTQVARPKATSRPTPWTSAKIGGGCAASSAGVSPPERRSERDDADEKEEETEERRRRRPPPIARSESGAATARRRAGQSSARTLGPATRIRAAARPTLSRSPVRKGTKPTRNAAAGIAAEQRELCHAAEMNDDHAERAEAAAPGGRRRRRRAARPPRPRRPETRADSRRWGRSAWTKPADPPANTGKPEHAEREIEHQGAGAGGRRRAVRRPPAPPAAGASWAPG